MNYMTEAQEIKEEILDLLCNIEETDDHEDISDRLSQVEELCYHFDSYLGVHANFCLHSNYESVAWVEDILSLRDMALNL